MMVEALIFAALPGEIASRFDFQPVRVGTCVCRSLSSPAFARGRGGLPSGRSAPLTQSLN